MKTIRWYRVVDNLRPTRNAAVGAIDKDDALSRGASLLKTTDIRIRLLKHPPSLTGLYSITPLAQAAYKSKEVNNMVTKEPTTKMFNGKRYKFDEMFLRKQKAKACAKSWRKDYHFHARVVTRKVNEKVTVYDVYIRKMKGVRRAYP